MKNTIAALAITTLAAAASAQTAAPVAGLSYNRVTVSRQGQNNSISASAFLGSSNVLATIGSSTQTVIIPTFFDPIVETRNVTTFSLGYVFKNVAFGTDATVGITSGNNSVNTAVSVNLRRALNEVVHGLEIAVGASFSENADFSGEPANKGSSTVVTAELAYNINKTFQVAYGISNANPTADIAHVVSVRYNF
jgi:hypothetical protein